MKYIIGDIHGEVDKLAKLLDFVASYDHDPVFVFIGDYLDKGQNSQAACELLLSYAGTESPHKFLWGNHEYMWSRAAMGDQQAISYLERYGGMTTVHDFGYTCVQTAAPHILEFVKPIFDRLVSFVIYKHVLVVHAGIDKVDRYSTIEEVPLPELLFARYPFIERQGRTYGAALTVFGHTGFYTPYRDPYKIGIDTAAVYLQGQPLTAYCVDSDLFLDSGGRCYSIPAPFTTCPVIPRVKPYRNN